MVPLVIATKTRTHMDRGPIVGMLIWLFGIVTSIMTAYVITIGFVLLDLLTSSFERWVRGLVGSPNQPLPGNPHPAAPFGPTAALRTPFGACATKESEWNKGGASYATPPSTPSVVARNFSVSVCVYFLSCNQRWKIRPFICQTHGKHRRWQIDIPWNDLQRLCKTQIL